MGVAGRAEALYRAYMSSDDLAMVDGLDATERERFWTRVYYEAPRRMRRLAIQDVGMRVSRGITLGRIRRSVTARDLFDSLWEPIKPHAWFKRTFR